MGVTSVLKLVQELPVSIQDKKNKQNEVKISCF